MNHVQLFPPLLVCSTVSILQYFVSTNPGAGEGQGYWEERGEKEEGGRGTVDLLDVCPNAPPPLWPPSSPSLSLRVRSTCCKLILSQGLTGASLGVECLYGSELIRILDVTVTGRVVLI